MKQLLALFLFAIVPLFAQDPAYDIEDILKNKDPKELLKIIRDEKISEVQKWPAIVAYAKLDGERSVPILAEMINKKKYSWYVRTAIAEGLVVVGNEDALKTLHSMLSDNSLVVRTIVVDALAEMEDPKSFSLLSEEIKSKRNFSGEYSLWIRKHLIDAIAKTGKKRSVPVLITYLDDPDTDVATKAKKNLADYVKMSGKENWSKRNWIDWWMSSGNRL